MISKLESENYNFSSSEEHLYCDNCDTHFSEYEDDNGNCAFCGHTLYVMEDYSEEQEGTENDANAEILVDFKNLLQKTSTSS